MQYYVIGSGVEGNAWSLMSKQNCINHESRVEYARGLCRPCYVGVLTLVKEGKQTWEDAEAAGESIAPKKDMQHKSESFYYDRKKHTRLIDPDEREKHAVIAPKDNYAITITASVPAVLIKWVDEEAAKRGIPFSWVIAECIYAVKMQNETKGDEEWQG